jgi:hypothetical protein
MSDSPGQTGLLQHNVYFTLRDAAPAACERMQLACRKYLASHPGIVSFHCGLRASELNRDVNDREFHIGLHIVFRDRPSHDAYQVSSDHRQFIEENKANWQRVRVFDSFVAVPTPAC